MTQYDLEWQLFRTMIHLWSVGTINDCLFDTFLTHTKWSDPANERVANVFLRQESEGRWHSRS